MNSLRIAVLVILFLHSKTGLALNLHFCGDHLANISWAFNAKGCGMELPEQQQANGYTIQKAHCCNDSAFIAQDQSPQKSFSFKAYWIAKNTLRFSITEVLNLHRIEGTRTSILISESPPPSQKRYKNYCQFIFYS